ncbi:MAG: Alanine dehydrogenase 2 [Bacteroidetes bacterium ADurb.Bin234]|nr:MAG: Alanine dehydrogenase 2 [Bacteroidetes bacterium ADurb.Bin234]
MIMINVGIRHEDKYEQERRVAISPSHAKRLMEKHPIAFYVESSEKRAFSDDEFEQAGCSLVNRLDEQQVVFGLKEIPLPSIAKNKTYVIFSHVIKGQSYNMPMLKKMMDNHCSLIDYECIVDDNNKRLIFFGRYAGLAGMTNSLWAFGLRMKHLGVETPFQLLKQTHTYFSLEDVKKDISTIGKEISEKGLPSEITPLTIGITGYGNVSKGAQEILSLLPTIEISPEELLALKQSKKYSNKHLYKIVFHEKHIARHKEGKPFELNEFFSSPSCFESDFDKYVPNLQMLVNCMYWDSRYDRLITKDLMEKLYKKSDLDLKVIGDITCDPNGSIEATHMGTPIDDPIFVYHPITRKPTFGYKGEGVVIMAIDILPSELPRDASLAFADALEPFVFEIAACNYNLDFENLKLPLPIKKALILHNGKLTPKYQYIQNHIDSCCQ